jgi:hypothetical protein
MPAKLGCYIDRQEQLLQPQVLLSVVSPADIKYIEVLKSNNINNHVAIDLEVFSAISIFMHKSKN